MESNKILGPYETTEACAEMEKCLFYESQSCTVSVRSIWVKIFGSLYVMILLLIQQVTVQIFKVRTMGILVVNM